MISSSLWSTGCFLLNSALSLFKCSFDSGFSLLGTLYYLLIFASSLCISSYISDCFVPSKFLLRPVPLRPYLLASLRGHSAASRYLRSASVSCKKIKNSHVQRDLLFPSLEDSFSLLQALLSFHWPLVGTIPSHGEVPLYPGSVLPIR